ncbi:1-deoxy-D-xylulose-5-phosphate synthase [Planosporangium thailandense]|uniref:1-deoxy-D-xylulose-5-phosphate synthase n=1 Tax=Planosporangium thailandense TaxID=765197 RepID=A0ABX0XZD9_9ACTN|nr:1-deoxy-D-xylulose-5-phosphate synthase [Planosporangium thailandense]NJC71186.1 1-deoxy-D-xylulose-5-phosphate synthase [Planosporangium thailandense]
MPILDLIAEPADLADLDHDQLTALAAEIRAFLVESVCRAGGHLGPNLGAVELTIAIHRTFRSPHDRIIFDTGHQAYTHKILTGRRDRFGTLRRAGGLSGYPSRAESPHDLTENSHASTALSYADGLARAYALDGCDRAVVAVVGDGAVTGGLTWEALNNLAVSPGRVVVVLNDNGRSYGPTAGGVAAHLARLRGGDRTLGDLFGALGLGYLGPVDGHDLPALEAALARARDSGRTVVVHCVTRKGLGYPPAEADEVDRMHTVPVIDPETGHPARSPGRTWTDLFGSELLALGGEREDLIAVSAAMTAPTGLTAFGQAFPERLVDTGIAEQHAVTAAAGLALGGKHPVVAIYATFLNRAFDQVLLDVALHRLPVTFVLDRSGITGPDGPSHHGMWDLAVLGVVPGLRIAAPRDATTLREELREAVGHGGPTVVRFPKADVAADIPPVRRVRGLDLLRLPSRPRTLLVGVGALAGTAMAAADLLAAAGEECTVLDPRWVRPINPALATLARAHRLVVTVEDGVRSGGVGAAIAQFLSDREVPTPVRALGLPTRFVPHGSRDELLSRYRLDPEGVAAAVLDALARPQSAEPHPWPGRPLAARAPVNGSVNG